MGQGRSPPRYRGDGRQLCRGASEPPRGAGEGPGFSLHPAVRTSAAGGAPWAWGGERGAPAGRGFSTCEDADRDTTGRFPGWSLLASPSLLVPSPYRA